MWENHKESPWPVKSQLADLRKGYRPPAVKSFAEGDLCAVCGARSIRRLCSHFVSIAEVGKRRMVTHDFG
jgi:hypothetical protein